MRIVAPMVALWWLIATSATCLAQGATSNPPAAAQAAVQSYVEPHFLLTPNPEISDYRPVVNADASSVIFERTFASNPNVTTLYSLSLVTHAVTSFVTIPSSRADWCWLRAMGSLTPGPVAFSNEDGVYVVAADGGSPTLLPGTKGMIYPSWYPDCQSIAVDVTKKQVSAKIDAKTGKKLLSPLANDNVWAGFPSVDQDKPNLVAFAGQNNHDSNYYNQDINYIWVTDTATGRVSPLDRSAPKTSGFFQIFQGRAGWWSPDGKWFAFESNRSCNQIEGDTYAIFVQDAAGAAPAVQVTSCKWNVQHPKWFPPGSTGYRTLLIVAAALPGQSEAFEIATLDVSDFVNR